MGGSEKTWAWSWIDGEQLERPNNSWVHRLEKGGTHRNILIRLSPFHGKD